MSEVPLLKDFREEEGKEMPSPVSEAPVPSPKPAPVQKRDDELRPEEREKIEKARNASLLKPNIASISLYVGLLTVLSFFSGVMLVVGYGLKVHYEVGDDETRTTHIWRLSLGVSLVSTSLGYLSFILILRHNSMGTVGKVGL
jgi:hypothetical protein